MESKEQLQYRKLVMTPVETLIPRLAVPTIFSMMTTMIYNLVDAFFVGRLGTSASAAIGIVMSIQALFLTEMPPSPPWRSSAASCPSSIPPCWGSGRASSPSPPTISAHENMRVSAEAAHLR